MNKEELEKYYNEVYKDLPEMLVLFCKNCKKSFYYNEFTNGCCPNCGKLHSEYRPKKKICEKCGARNKMRDKFCKYCGAPLGKEFIPYLNENDCIYGPPPFSMDFECKTCGHKWSGFSNEDYCPKCGKEDLERILTEDEEWLNRWGFSKEFFLKNIINGKIVFHQLI